jgi:putative membrane protein insertion efficiency factor
VLLGVDASRPADRQVSTTVVLAGLTVYQATLARVYAATGVTCRFSPTCSHYAAATLRHHGLVEGGWLALRRVVRCGPWTPAGTVDPPPGRPQALEAGSNSRRPSSVSSTQQA